MNPVVVDKISKRFLFFKDSGFIFTKNLIKSLPKNYRYYWLIPENIKQEDEQWFLEANSNIELLRYPYSTSVHQNRYEFYGNVLKKHFPYTKDIDVIINNQPEVSASLKVWLDNQRRDDSIILNFYHWIDCELSRKFAKDLGGYYIRQYEGFKYAELNYFHSDFAYGLFAKQFEKEFGKCDESEALLNKTTYKVFHPPATTYGNEPMELPEGKKILLFNHRLNGTTGWKYVIDTCNELYKTRKDFVLWITDEEKIQQNESIKKKYPFVIMQSAQNENYGFLLRNSSATICNVSGYGTWNMSVLDSLKNNCIAVVPSTDLFMSMLKEFKGALYFEDSESSEFSLKNILNAVLDNNKTENICEAPFEYNLNDIRESIESSVREKLNNVNAIKKYDDVVEFIKSNPRSKKKDFVNHFWSFHVNSNFQKIRWKMLSCGKVNDDVKESEPTYICVE